jgi:hypothetical protein
MTWLYLPKACRISVCAAEEEGLTLESDWRFQVLAASATWRGKHLPWQRWLRLSKRALWMTRLCGAMPPPSTANLGVAEWLASLAERPVRTSASPGSALGSTENAPGSSSSSSASSASASRNGSSGRTSGAQLLLFPPSSPPSKPRATAAPGPAFVRVTLAPLTSAPASSCWPTATAQRSGNNRGGAAGRVGPVRPSLDSLATMVAARLWSTPRASPNENRNTKPAPSHGVTYGRTLSGDAILWATATARDWKSGEHSEATERRNARPLAEQAWRACHSGPLAPLMSPAGSESSPLPPGSHRLSLNPAFVAWLMGWRWCLADWTDLSSLDYSGTESCPSRQHTQSAA